MCSVCCFGNFPSSVVQSELENYRFIILRSTLSCQSSLPCHLWSKLALLAFKLNGREVLTESRIMESLKIYSSATNEITPSEKEDHVMAQRKVSKWFFLSTLFPKDELSSSKTRLYLVSLYVNGLLFTLLLFLTRDEPCWHWEQCTGLCMQLVSYWPLSCE